MQELENFEWVYLDATGFCAYELSSQEIEWLNIETRPLDFWLQRQPLIGKYGGYVRRSEVEGEIEIRPPRTHHYDGSHPN